MDAETEAPKAAENCAESVVSDAQSQDRLATAAPKAAENCAESVGSEAQSQATSELATSSRLHLACRGFQGLHLEALQKKLKELSPVPVVEVFKQKSWRYAFASVANEDVERFREAASAARFKGESVSISDGHSKTSGERRPVPDDGADERPKKKQKGAKEFREFPAGYVPTLKELKDKAKQRKVNGIEDTTTSRSSPLSAWPYETQLSMKATYAKTAARTLQKSLLRSCEEEFLTPPKWTSAEWAKARRVPAGCACPLEEPIGCPVEGLEGYRNKCEFTCALNAAGEVEVGFVAKVSPELGVIVSSCEEESPVPAQMKRFCKALRDCVRASDIPVYDRRDSHRTGVWRLVTVRLTPSGEMLFMMQTTTLSDEMRERVSKILIDALTSTELGVVSIHLQYNDEVTDAARPDARVIHVHGQHTIQMPLLSCNFALGPLSFWNPNTATNAALYAKALEWLDPQPDDLVLDVCCGIGSYAILSARRCREAIGVDVSSDDVASAKANAELNDVQNVSFRCGKVEDVLPGLLGDLPADAKVCAVIDPPRPGVHRKAIDAMRRCHGLHRIVYVSCNPDSLAEDAARLSMPDEVDPFVPVRAVTVDTFPQTLQYEMIMQLDRSSRFPDPCEEPAKVTDAASVAASAQASGCQ